ncbi:peptide-methionine (S)-S-oxide reductase MsrA [Chloroflexi bacterium]|nr:peptide-methionine (S)-S-oxide reductase MsrA [Chloroflexota bacterium]|tara:strand:+ start:596 stop:1054 length:459 start_codon:yes stop_codon:yes gene_type:complete
MNTAILAAGCFWGIEEVFRTTKGVIDTKVGYTGGTKIDPTYEEVCTDLTGHAEVVKVDFDEAIISYNDILNIFFANHNPTQLNRQGPDVGTQYRSSVFYLNSDQKEIAVSKIKSLQPQYNNSIVTEVVEGSQFYLAEEYHQQYVAKGGICHF